MDGFVGEIRAIPYSFVPANWVPCFGQTLPVQQYPALFAILGSIYGPSTNSTFTVPDLRGHAIVGQGTGPNLTPRTLGQNSGTETVTLTSSNQLPPHQHTFQGATGGVNARVATPGPNDYLTNFGTGAAGATSFTTVPGYVTLAPPLVPNTMLSPATIAPAGGGQAHENRQPYLAVIYCICTIGEFLPNPN